MRGPAGSVPQRSRFPCVFAALAVVLAFAWMPARAFADEPQVASSGASDSCIATDASCAADTGADAPLPAGGARLIPSRPSEIARGHGDQSAPALVVLGLAAFAGLVVSVLHRLSLEE